MSLTSWIKSLLGKSIKGLRQRHPVRKPARSRPTLEDLEDRTLLSVTPLNVPEWASQGPNPIQDGEVGAIESVDVAHVNPSASNPGGYIVYAGTVDGGVWRADNIGDGMLTGSTDPNAQQGGIQWRALTDSQASLSVSSVKAEADRSTSARAGAWRAFWGTCTSRAWTTGRRSPSTIRPTRATTPPAATGRLP
jgi:hypothetical protein